MKKLVSKLYISDITNITPYRCYIVSIVRLDKFMFDKSFGSLRIKYRFGSLISIRKIISNLTKCCGNH